MKEPKFHYVPNNFGVPIMKKKNNEKPKSTVKPRLKSGIGLKNECLGCRSL